MDAAALAQFEDGAASFPDGAAQKKTEAKLVDFPSNLDTVKTPSTNTATSAALRVAANITAKAAARAEAIAAGGDPDNHAAAIAAASAPVLVPKATIPAFALQPVPALNWDGDWPDLAAALPVRGVALQLALQSELIICDHGDGGTEFNLRTPLETLCAAANIEKLAAALTERFARPVRVKTEIGQVWHTANARAEAARAVLQQQAEQQIQNDPFVQKMMREFGAIVVPGSIRPIAAM